MAGDTEDGGEPPPLPPELQLHVERNFGADGLTFREMCGESTFIPACELHHIRKVGAGSFATVEICRYTPADGPERLVAVKRLTSHAAVDVERFASEANTLRRLRHRHIVGFVGVGSEDSGRLLRQTGKTSCYLVQEWVDGGTLKQKLWRQARQRRHVYSDLDALRWGRQVAAGLAYLHGATPVVLHRDLKLENILLQSVDGGARGGPRFTARICDFGLAASLADPQLGLRPRPAAPPAGLSFSRHGSDFHSQMQRHVRGGGGDGPGPDPELRAASALLDRRLSRISARPALEKGASLTRGSVLPPSTPRSPRSPAARPPRLLLPPSPPLGCVGGGKAECALLQAGEVAPDPEGEPGLGEAHHPAYSLTGRAGSFLYMAPEVVMCQPYNEKADVFSLGVILLELFLRKPLAAVLAQLELLDGRADPRLAEMYAYKVAAGFRHPLPDDWPPGLRSLIADCWAQDPDLRPSAEAVGRRLAELEAYGVLRDESLPPQRKGCCVLQ